jgi:hypothetical protein
MDNVELKANLHSFIDKLENNNLLHEYYNELKRILSLSQGKIWDSLTEEQKKEVLISFEESEDDSNLLDNETVMSRYKKWLKK